MYDIFNRGYPAEYSLEIEDNFFDNLTIAHIIRQGNSDAILLYLILSLRSARSGGVLRMRKGLDPKAPEWDEYTAPDFPQIKRMAGAMGEGPFPTVGDRVARALEPLLANKLVQERPDGLYIPGAEQRARRLNGRLGDHDGKE